MDLLLFIGGWVVLTTLCVVFMHGASYKDNISRNPNYYKQD